MCIGSLRARAHNTFYSIIVSHNNKGNYYIRVMYLSLVRRKYKNYSITSLDRSLGLLKVEAALISSQSAHEGG